MAKLIIIHVIVKVLTNTMQESMLLLHLLVIFNVTTVIENMIVQMKVDQVLLVVNYQPEEAVKDFICLEKFNN